MLLLLAHFGKEGSSQTITPNISQETLADMIGTTRSRVSYSMNKFRKLGLISYNGHIEVNSARLDAVLRDNPPHLPRLPRARQSATHHQATVAAMLSSRPMARPSKRRILPT